MQSGFKVVSRVFERHLKGVSEKFPKCFKKVSREFQKSLKGVPRKIEGCFKKVFNGFQGYLKVVQREFQRAPMVFQGCSKEVLRVFQ